MRRALPHQHPSGQEQGDQTERKTPGNVNQCDFARYQLLTLTDGMICVNSLDVNLTPFAILLA